MPNRYIRESAIESERVNALSWFGEVFYRRLLNRVDDFGRYTANVELLRSALFPLQLSKVSGADVAGLLSECEQWALVSTYTAGDGKQYLAVHKFEKGRAKTSRYPDPPPDICERMKADANGCRQMRTNVPDSDPDPDPDSDPGRGTRAREGSALVLSREEAVAQAASAGAAPDFAGYVWDDWSGRGGKDAAGNARQWANYIATRWSRERKEWTNGTHKGKRGQQQAGGGTTRAGPDRNAGTALDPDYARKVRAKADRMRAELDAVARKVARP